jgi:threonine dehydratase
LTVVPPYDDYHIAAGQGTCALELFEDVPDLDALLTPCGGGGLFAGASTAAKAVSARGALLPRRVGAVGRHAPVVPQGRARPHPAARDGRRRHAHADARRAHLPRAAPANAEDVLTVSEDEIVEAMRFLLFRLKILVEPTGAVAAAAALFGKLPARHRARRRRPLRRQR